MSTLYNFCDDTKNGICVKVGSLLKSGFPYGSDGKESACNARDLGLIPGLGRSPGEGKGYSLQYSSLENSMGCLVSGVAKNWTRLSDFHFSKQYYSVQSGFGASFPFITILQ